MTRSIINIIQIWMTELREIMHDTDFLLELPSLHASPMILFFIISRATLFFSAIFDRLLTQFDTNDQNRLAIYDADIQRAQPDEVDKIKIYPHPYRDAGSSVRNAIGCGSGAPF